MMQCLSTRVTAAAPAVAPRPQNRPTRAVVMRSSKDNAYHDRDAVNPQSKGASKDANALKADQKEQMEYQQERLEWRRKHQTGGDDKDRKEAPKVNFPSKDTGGASAEFRAKGPDRSDHPAPSTDLASASNPIGNLIRKVTGGEATKE